MSEEEILSELRTIRTLLTLDKEEQLQELLDNTSELQKDVLAELGSENWESGFIDDIAESHDVSGRTVRRAVNDLVDKNLVEKQGSGSGNEYRKTGLYKATALIEDL